MRTKKEIEERIKFINRQIWKNDNNLYTWCKLKEYLEWVIEPKKKKG